jgi:general secretion pathway protein G
MNRRKNERRRAQAGFTLVEVLIVLAILAMLAGMILPRVLGSKKTADINAVKAQVGGFQGALEQYALHMNDFPTTEQGLAALIEAPESSDEESGGNASKWDCPYLSKGDLPADPWGNDYQYEYPATHSKSKDSEIWSFGPDGVDDTEDDITSWKRESEEGESEPSSNSSSSSNE